MSVGEHGFIETDTSELCRSCVRSHFYFPPLIAGCRSIRLQCLHVLVICSHHQMLPRFVLSGQKRRKTMDRFRSDVVLRRVVTCLTVRVRVHLSIFIAVVVAIRELGFLLGFVVGTVTVGRGLPAGLLVLLLVPDTRQPESNEGGGRISQI